MRVIVGCEFSQVVTAAFRERGHEAYSCDLLPTEGNPEWHIQDDVLKVLEREQFDLAIFHPPCTYLANSGVRWLFTDLSRWSEMAKGALFFRKCLDADIPKIAVENPIIHKHAMAIIDRPCSQIIQPYEFGHGETKATCLWLKGLPPLMATEIVTERVARVHKEPPGPDRWKNRSRTLPGIARAMAEQWSEDLTI